MAKGKPKKRYTPEFKKLVVETYAGGKLSYGTLSPLEAAGSRQGGPEWPGNGCRVRGGK
jgi:hypothetical protein